MTRNGTWGRSLAASRIVRKPWRGISFPTKSTWNCAGGRQAGRNKCSSAPTKQNSTRSSPASSAIADALAAVSETSRRAERELLLGPPSGSVDLLHLHTGTAQAREDLFVSRVTALPGPEVRDAHY